MIVDTTNQALAPNLRIGERLIPQVIVRAADARPENIQELIPADTRFKLLLFPGDISDPVQKEKLENLARAFSASASFIHRFTPKSGKPDAVFDIVTIWSVPPRAETLTLRTV